MKGAISETVSDMRGQVRNLRADMREMQHSLLALDERVPRLESEQRPADHRAAEAADVPALPTAVSSGTSQVHHVTLESRRASANTVTPAETVAQRTIRRDDPLHAAQAGPRAAALGQSWGSSHDPHVRVDATPTPVSGMTRGSAARTRREAQGSQSAAPALPQSFPPSAGVWVGRFYEEAGGTVTRAPAPSADSEAPVARRNYRATSAAEVSSSWTRRFSSERSFQILAGAPAGASLSLATTPNYASPARASLSASTPVLPCYTPVEAAAKTPRARRQRAQEPQRRHPPLSALLDGIDLRRPATATAGSQHLSSGSRFYAEVVRRHVRQSRDANVLDRGEEEEEEQGGWMGWFQQGGAARTV